MESPAQLSGKCEQAKKRDQSASKKKINQLDGGIGDNSCTDNDEWEDSHLDIVGPNM